MKTTEDREHPPVLMAARWSHQPPCPAATATDRLAAVVIAAHPEQGWSLLCNRIITFDDTGALDARHIIRPAVPESTRAGSVSSTCQLRYPHVLRSGSTMGEDHASTSQLLLGKHGHRGSGCHVHAAHRGGVAPACARQGGGRRRQRRARVDVPWLDRRARDGLAQDACAGRPGFTQVNAPTSLPPIHAYWDAHQPGVDRGLLPPANATRPPE